VNLQDWTLVAVSFFQNFSLLRSIFWKIEYGA
jgi:hypothetical protein